MSKKKQDTEPTPEKQEQAQDPFLATQYKAFQTERAIINRTDIPYSSAAGWAVLVANATKETIEIQEAVTGYLRGKLRIQFSEEGVYPQHGLAVNLDYLNKHVTAVVEMAVGESGVIRYQALDYLAAQLNDNCRAFGCQTRSNFEEAMVLLDQKRSTTENAKFLYDFIARFYDHLLNRIVLVSVATQILHSGRTDKELAVGLYVPKALRNKEFFKHITKEFI